MTISDFLLHKITNIFSILKEEEVTGVWRKLHNEELHNLYSSPNIIRGSGQEG
jgi:hypothetical protein